MKIGDDEAFACARRLIGEEGFLCGGSSGTALAGTLKFIKENDIGEGVRQNVCEYVREDVSDDVRDEDV